MCAPARGGGAPSWCDSWRSTRIRSLLCRNSSWSSVPSPEAIDTCPPRRVENLRSTCTEDVTVSERFLARTSTAMSMHDEISARTGIILERCTCEKITSAMWAITCNVSPLLGERHSAPMPRRRSWRQEKPPLSQGRRSTLAVRMIIARVSHASVLPPIGGVEPLELDLLLPGDFHRFGRLGTAASGGYNMLLGIGLAQ